MNTPTPPNFGACPLTGYPFDLSMKNAAGFQWEISWRQTAVATWPLQVQGKTWLSW